MLRWQLHLFRVVEFGTVCIIITLKDQRNINFFWSAFSVEKLMIDMVSFMLFITVFRPRNR